MPRRWFSGWRMWTRSECFECGARNKVTRGGYYNPVRKLIWRVFRV